MGELDPRRAIPRTDAVLSHPRVIAASERLSPEQVRAVTRQVQEQARVGAIAPADVIDHVLRTLADGATSMRAVLNATGVIVHTNLGRAPLSDAARDAIVVAAGYVDVEFDLASGTRARRGRGAIDVLCAAVPEAEEALVVNNNAAALVLAATALAAGREIIISRGELVEIGDGFRLPDLLESTGARLREVGTTNRTTVEDYARAIGSDTALLMKVHPSNFVIKGFTATPTTAELAALGVPVVVDIGSGLLGPEPILPDEPDARSELAAGAGLVTASGDKLLGGPQAGVLLGSGDLIDALRHHPLARAVRADKLALAALEATLRGSAPPVITGLRRDPATLLARASDLADRLRTAGIPASAVETVGRVGGGGGPGVDLPSAAVRLPAPYAAALRAGRPPVVSRLEADRCLLDLRAIAPADDEQLFAAVTAACTSRG